MTKVLCSIYDCKAEVWSAPQLFRNKAEAIRALEDAVNGDTVYAQHAEDYTLFVVGEFDELSGVIYSYDAPISVERAINLVKGVD